MKWYKASQIKQAQQRITIDYNELARATESKNFCTDASQSPGYWGNTVAGIIYAAITNQGGMNGNQDMQLWNQFTEGKGAQSSLAQAYLQATGSQGDAWAQFDPMGKGWKGQNDTNQNNLNFYFTLEKTPENLKKFLNKLRDLYKTVQEYAVKNQTRVSFKMPGTLGGWIKHNDSLKVYFNNVAIKDQVNQLVTSWLSSNGISTSTRTHSFGQDVGQESYGVRIAMRAQSWVQQAVNQGHPTATIIEGFKKLESNFFKSL